MLWPPAPGRPPFGGLLIHISYRNCQLSSMQVTLQTGVANISLGGTSHGRRLHTPSGARVIAAYNIIADSMQELGHHSHRLAKVSDPEIVTVAVAAAKFFHNH